MPQKPANVIFGLDDKPPLGTTAFLGFQHVCLVAISLVFPALLIYETGGSPEQADFMIDMSLLAGGLGAILQSLPRGPVGCGYFCPQLCGPSFWAASLAAAKLGGLPLVLGMTAVAGLIESIFSRFMHKLRGLFPPEVIGLIVALVGITVIRTAMNSLTASDPQAEAFAHHGLLIGLVTLGVMIALNIWTKGNLRLFCSLIGMAAGYGLSIASGLVHQEHMLHVGQQPWIDLPVLDHPGLAFDCSLILPLVVATLCSTLKTVGDITTCQKINDEQWKRPDMTNIKKGILADGLTCLTAGVVGGFGQSTSSSNIGLSIATGATSRVIGVAVGAIMIVMSLCPKLAAVFTVMPRPVMGGTLLFAMSFMVVAGVQIITSRMLDSRKTFVVGLSLIIGLSVDITPQVYEGLPEAIRPIFGSSLSAGAICAVFLNLVFRLGLRKSAQTALPATAQAQGEAVAFLKRQGAAWGARAEVINRAAAGLSELVELLTLHGMVRQGGIDVQASFDELSVSLKLSYAGQAVELPPAPPEASTILEDQLAQRRLGGFLIGKYADQVEVARRGEINEVRLRWEH